MREILFRGKTFAGDWVEGFLFQMCGDCVINWCISRTPICANDYSDILGDWAEILPETVGQYTGLTDKNGKKIFEGDICQDEHSVVLVLWQSHKWCCKVLKGCVLSRGCAFPLWQWDNCPENGNRQLEVIGNIHDNSELLKGERNEAD